MPAAGPATATGNGGYALVGEADRRKGPRLFHPLMGANPATLFRVLRANGGVPLSRTPHATLAMLASLARWPFTAYERVRVAGWRRRRGGTPAPVFIVGHWRSGTTHLYSLLARSPRFAYVPPLAVGLPWDFLVLGAALRPLLERALPADRFIDQVAVNPDSPQEDEIALANMQALSFYHGLYFPRRFRKNFEAGVFFDGCDAGEVAAWQDAMRLFLDKVSLQQPGRRVLIKNPVYTARVAMLRKMWPDAKFIHIYRNPYVVFQSTRNFYRALFAELALQPPDDVDVDALILDAYPRMMNAVLEDTRSLPEGQFAELRFEEFEQRPLEEAERIYRTLDLEDFETDRPAFEAYLGATRGYRKNQYRFPEEDIERVSCRWGEFVQRWEYEPPR